MPKIPILGPTYRSQSLNIAADRSINFYPDLNLVDSKSQVALVGTPGCGLQFTVGSSPVRGMRVFNNTLFIVAGATLYSADLAGNLTNLGNLNTSSGRVDMADNGVASAGIGGNQLMIVDGPYGYIWNVNTLVWSLITGGGWPSAGASSVCYIDGYFVICKTGSMSAFSSNLFDGTTWNSLATTPIQASPDLLVGVFNVREQLCFLKQYSMEWWYNAGIATATGFPFQRTPGAVGDYGVVSNFSVTQADNSLLFPAIQRTNDTAQFIGIVEMNGYQPTIISPPAITYQISRFATISDCFSYSYAEAGHLFHVFTFPTANATFVYDSTVQMWHERSTVYGLEYVVNRHISNCYAYFNGKHLVGDWQTGNVYWMDSSIFTDNGYPIISERVGQHFFDQQDYKNVFISKLVVDAEGGVGQPVAGPANVVCTISLDTNYIDGGTPETAFTIGIDGGTP